MHRRVYLDYIGIKRFDGAGRLVGERRFCGLFTSTAYTRPPRSIPYLRRKIDGVIRRAGFDPASHSGKALVNVVETYPRDELFQIDEDALYQFALAIMQLDERPRACVLPRRDRFDRFMSVLVHVPRDRYDSKVRAAIGNYPATAFNGHVSAYHPFFTEGPLVRVHFIIGRNRGEALNPDRTTLDRDVQAIVRSWTDDLCEALSAGADPARASALSRAIVTLSRSTIAKLIRRRWRSPISASSRRSNRSGRSAWRSIREQRGGPQSAGLRSFPAMTGRFRCRSACRFWKTWASASSTSAPITSSRRAASWFGSTTWRSKARSVAISTLPCSRIG